MSAVVVDYAGFRPCIDIHDGKVKQIVGSTLTSNASDVRENFVSDKPPSYFADLYRKHNLRGGHIIMLGTGNEAACFNALSGFKGGMQVGGGVTPSNAKSYLDAGASHVIVTSYVFRDGKIDMDKLKEMVGVVGKNKLVLDLSCRRRPDEPNNKSYYVVTDRWQKFTDFAITHESLKELSSHCDEFLVHGVDVEGKRQGIIADLVVQLGEWSPIKVTYAGGVRSVQDMDLVKLLGKNKVDVSIGSALDVFGGDLAWKDVVEWHETQKNFGIPRDLKKLWAIALIGVVTLVAVKLVRRR